MSPSQKSDTAKLHTYLSICIYGIVCGLFLLKYLMRINIPVCVVGIAIFGIVTMCVTGLKDKLGRIVVPLLIVYTLAALIAIPRLFPAGTFNIDRWDMIDSFFRTLGNGDYPYAAIGSTSGNSPAQSPVYFYLCYPFYLLRWYAGIPLAGLWIYWGISRMSKIADRDWANVLLLIAPFTVYEMLTCSTIFFNSVLVLAWMVLFNPAIISSRKKMILHGLAGGLLLCTRNCFIIPVVILGLTLLCRYRNRNVILWGVMILLAFLAGYLPYVFAWGLDSWMRINPFAVQSDLILSPLSMAVIVVGSIITGFCCRSVSKAIYLSGIWLFAAACLVIIETTLNVGFNTAFFDSRADVTYFILCIPFILTQFNRQPNDQG